MKNTQARWVHIGLFTYLTMFSVGAFATPAGDLNLTPSAVKLRLYKFAVSTSPLCTNLITVVDNGDAPTEVDFSSQPNLGTGRLDAGTYPCLALEISDLIRFTPGSTSASGGCQAGVQNTLDICRADNGNLGNPATSKMIDGSTTTCTGTSTSPSSDRVTIFISTYSDPTSSGDGFQPPVTQGGDGSFLNTALTVGSAGAATFVTDPSRLMCDNTNDTGTDCDGGGASPTCKLEGVKFSIRY